MKAGNRSRVNSADPGSAGRNQFSGTRRGASGRPGMRLPSHPPAATTTCAARNSTVGVRTSTFSGQASMRGDHGVRVDVGTEPLGGICLGADVALGVADPRARVPDRHVAGVQAGVLRLPGGQFIVAQLNHRQPGAAAAAASVPRTASAVRGTHVQAARLVHQSLPGFCAEPVHSSSDFSAIASQPRVLPAGDPEQPRRSVRGPELMPNAMPLDSRRHRRPGRQPPQRADPNAPSPTTTTSLRMTSIPADPIRSAVCPRSAGPRSQYRP